MKEADIKVVYPDPFEQFEEWYKILIEGNKENFNAMTLASSYSSGRVSARIVLLKKFDKDGFVFFSNYQSKKGIQISENPMAALLFYWPDLGRQIRIEGKIEKVSETESDDYFNSRPKGHMINAIASNQSCEIPNKDSLLKRFESLVLQYANTSPVRPSGWGGYRLEPELFEFWQSGSHRLHNRMEYRLINGRWVIRQLAP